jgi:hypothetical protein
LTAAVAIGAVEGEPPVIAGGFAAPPSGRSEARLVQLPTQVHALFWR